MPLPLFEQLTQAGGRQSGTPVNRSLNNGVGVSPSQPSYPAPPSVTTGAPGRPSSRPAGPVGVATQTAPVAPVASPAGPTPAGPTLAPHQPTTQDPMQPKVDPNQPPGHPHQHQPSQPAAPSGPPPPAATTTPGGGITLQLNRIPARRDYVGLLPGTGISTPYGHATLGADGKPVIQFPSAEHEQRYRTDTANYAKRFGPTPLSSFPGAPQPPITLGSHAYNPFTGAWLTPDQ